MIRSASPEDARRIAEITVVGWECAYSDIVPAMMIERQTVEAQMSYWLRPDVYEPPMYAWVVETEGVVVGHAHVGPYRSKDGADATKAGELWSIYVDPEYWGNGYGQELLAVASSQLRALDYEVAHLWVLRDNFRARRFYERAGWVHADATRTMPMAGKHRPVFVEEVLYTHRVTDSRP